MCFGKKMQCGKKKCLIYAPEKCMNNMTYKNKPDLGV